MGVINELWRGNISPQEPHKGTSKEYRKIVSQICEQQEKIMSEMSEESRKQFLAYEDLLSAEECMSLERTFEDGFRLGAMFILDVMREQ